MFCGFSTRKCFAWRDLWDVRDASDRRIRRIMEKENKAARDEARKEYNNTVKQLTSFIRKRDPRYRNYNKKQQQYNSIEAIEQRRQEANEARKRDREVAAQSFVEQSWQQVQQNSDLEELEELEQFNTLHCFACDKTFSSEKAFENHERSKKHIKTVQMLVVFLFFLPELV